MVHSEEYNGIEITLCEERTAKLWVTVTAYIKDGKLTIEGQDLGDAPMTFFGTDEYEYYYFFDKDNTEKLLTEISLNVNDPISELQQRFSGMTACRDLRAFCEKHGIKYCFDSYM